MPNYVKSEALAEQATTSTTFVDVPGSEVTFTPGAVGDIWLIFVSGVMRSSSTADVAAEAKLLINGVDSDYFGTINNNATNPCASGIATFAWVTGTVAAQIVKMQYRAATGTTFLATLRVIACKLPAGADFQSATSDAIVSTTGSNVAILTMGPFTPPSDADYFVFYKVAHSESPGTGTSQAWVDDVASFEPTTLHPDAPVGTHHSNSLTSWNQLFGFFRSFLDATVQNIILRFTSSGSGGAASQHQYRRMMAFKASVWDATAYAIDTAETTTTSATFVSKTSLAVAAPATMRDRVILQAVRISGSSTGTSVQKAAEFRRSGEPWLRTNMRINRSSTATAGYHNSAAMVDARSENTAVTYENGFLAPNTGTVNCAESTIAVLQYPDTNPVQQQNAPFLAMVI